MKKQLLFFAFILLFISSLSGQVLDPNDPLVDYDSENPPSRPAWGEMGKWVRTKYYSWSTEDFKAYIYKNTAFRLRFPNNFDPSRAEKYPVILHLHGAGRVGTIYANEKPMNIDQKHIDEFRDGKYDAFLLFPQTNGGWNETNLGEVNEVLDYLAENANVDINKVGVYGTSNGAKGAWNYTVLFPERVACVIPMSGTTADRRAERIKHIPIWAVQGGKDVNPSPSATEALVNDIIEVGGNVQYTLYENAGHGTWFGYHYKDPDFIPYLLRGNKTNPWPLFEKKEFCPGEQINVTLGVTAGFDGYEWRKDGVVVSGENSNELLVTAVGIYDVRIKRGSEWSYWSPNPVEVKIKEPTVTPPIQLASGFSSVYPAPDDNNDVVLELPEGYEEYIWKKVGSDDIIGTERTLSVTSAGEYIASVTEKFGCSSNYSDPFTIIGANSPQAPASPLDLTAHGISKTEIELNWSENPVGNYNETGYEIYRSEESGSGFQLVAITATDVVSFVDSDLEPGEVYFYFVRAINTEGASEITDEVSAVTEVDITPPTSPANLEFSNVTSNSVTLNWEPSSDDVGIAKYDVYKGTYKVVVTENTSATVFNLIEGEVYNFSVRARDLTGNESVASNQVTVVAGNGELPGPPPASPSNLQASAISYEQINLNWEDNSDNETGFEIYRATSEYGPFNVITTTGENVTSYIDLNVNANTTYFYKLKAIGMYGESNPLAFAHFGFNGDYSDLSGHQVPAAPVNGPSFVGTSANELKKHYVIFDGNNDYVELGTTGSTGFMHDAFFTRTVAMWVKPLAVDSDRIIYDEGGATNGMAIRINNGVLEAVAEDNKIRHIVSTPVQSNEWYHVAFTFDNGVFKLFLNGVKVDEDASVAFNEVSSHGDNGAIGGTVGSNAFNDNGNMFEGYISDVIIYSESLADTDINFLFQNQVGSVAFTPAAFWELDGNYTDSSGNNQRAEAKNGPVFPLPEVKEGIQALSFDGSNDYVSLGENTGTGLFHDEFTARTVALWLKPGTTSNTRVVYDEGGSTNGIAIRINNGILEAAVRDNKNQKTISSNLSTTDWVHIAVVFDQGDFKLYIDGVEVASNANVGYTKISTHSDGAGLGATNGSNAFNSDGKAYQGLIDDFRFFGIALSEGQIAGLMTADNTIASASTFPLPPPPSAPDNLNVVAISGTQINITWVDNSEDEENILLYRSIANNSNFQLLAELPANTTTYNDTDLLANVTYFYKVAAVGIGGESTSDDANVKTLNSLPALFEIGDQSMKFDTELILNIFAEDENEEQLTIQVTNLPAFASFQDYGDGTGLITFTPDETEQGLYEHITVTVTDENGGEDTEVISLLVNNNYVPVLSPIGDYNLEEGETIQVELVATDSNTDDVLSWSFTNLPGFAEVSYDTDGQPSLNLTPSFTDAGTYSGIEIKVEDGNGGEAIELITIVVEDTDPNLAVYVNFANSTTATAPWNNVSSSSSGELNDVYGEASGISLAFEPAAWNAYRDGAITGDNSGVYPDNVIKDYYYFGIFGNPETPSIKVNGLETGKAYKFTFLGSSKWTGRPDNGTTVYEINGTSVSLYVQNNNQNTVSISNVSPDTNGEVVINMSKAADGTPVGYINALVIESLYESGNAPAPPANLSTNFIGDVVEVTWEDVPFDEESFEVFRSETATGPFVLIATLNPGSESYTDADVQGGKTYYYKVASVNTNGSSESGVEEVSIPAIPPTITSIDTVMAEAGVVVNIPVSISSTPDGPVTLAANNLPSFVTFTDYGDGTGNFEVAAIVDDIGVYENLEVTATDNQGTASELFVLQVTPKKLYSVQVNFTKNKTAPAPWNNTSKDPANGDVFPLVDDLGNGGISMKLLTNWGGSYHEGATTGNNSGIMPDNVLEEYYWFGAFGAPNEVQLEISGLDLTNTYNFKFVGSSEFNNNGITDNGETVYTIDNQSVSVDVQANTNRISTITGVSPNVSGKVVITISKGSGAPVGYINGMVIEAFESEDDGEVEATPLTAYGTSRSEIALSWPEALGATGYELYRATEISGTYSLIYSTIGTSFTDTGLSEGTPYYYQLKTIYAGSETVTDPVTASTLLYSVYINMNAESQYNAPAPWNNFGVMPGHGDSFGGYLNEDGNETGLVLEFEQSLTGSNDWGASTGNNSGIYPDNVTKSFFFMEVDEVAKIVIKGLDQSLGYNFVFFSSIVVNFSVTTDYTIGTETVVTEGKDNTSEVQVIRGVRPDENNEIILYITTAENWSIFNAMVIETYPYIGPSNARNAAISQTKVSFENQMQHMDLSDVNVYPNPFVDELNLHFDNLSNSLAEITLLDISGKIVLKDKVEVRMEKLSVPGISELKLQKGLYFLKIKFDNDKEKVFKLLKN